MIEISPAEHDVLLLHIVRCPEIFDEFIAKTRSTTFDKVLYVAHDFIAQTLVECHEEYGKYPGVAAMELRLSHDLSTSASLPSEAVESVEAMFDFIKQVPEEELSVEVARDILVKVVERQTAIAAKDKLLRALEGGGSLQTVLDDIQKDAAKRRMGAGGAKVVQPLKDPARFMTKSEVFPTGVDIVDIPLNGGLERHDLIGLLAPSGGGKTTLAVQLVTSWIRQGPDRRALLCSYEQPLEGDLMNRLLVSMTGLRSGLFRGKTMDELDASLKMKVSAAMKPCEDRLFVSDLSTNSFGLRGLDDIDELYNSCGPSNHGPPVLVVLDWFMPCVQRAMAGSGEKMTSSEALRLFGTRFMDKIKVWKNTKNVAVVISHQANPEAGNAANSRKPQWGDASEWKGFAFFPNVCFGVGTLSSEGIGWFCATKVRCHAKSEKLIKLQGELCRFVDADSEFMLSSGGKFVPKVVAAPDEADSGPAKPSVKADVTDQYMA